MYGTNIWVLLVHKNSLPNPPDRARWIQYSPANHITSKESNKIPSSKIISEFPWWWITFLSVKLIKHRLTSPNACYRLHSWQYHIFHTNDGDPHYTIFCIILLLYLLQKLTQISCWKFCSQTHSIFVLPKGKRSRYKFRLVYICIPCHLLTRALLDVMTANLSRPLTSHKQKNRNWKRNWGSLIAQTHKNTFPTLRIGDGLFFHWQY